MLISNSGHALIADFGYTYLANSSFSLGVSLYTGGTYNWMPPEALEANGQTIMTMESDVWSFAMTALVCWASYFLPRATNNLSSGTIRTANSFQ